jgi:MFS family permease
MTRDTLVWYGTLLHSVMTVAVALSGNLYLTSVAMVFSGMAWIVTANSLSVSVQLALPDWVRARGMSIFQMALMGASAAGAAAWGKVATLDSVQHSLLVSACSGAVVMLLVLRLVNDRGVVDDLTPSKAFKAPVAERVPERGRIVVHIEYRIDPSRADAFVKLMEESRRSRLRQGALGWELLQDIGDAGHYIEQIIDESWTEHLRRFDRVTEGDVALRERKLAFHLGETPPQVSRRVIVAP